MGAPRKYKIDSIFVFILAALFYLFFMYAKHDPALSKVNAFADDPYDAVGSFGIQAAIFLATVCLIRAFRSPADARAFDDDLFILRAQTAAVLSVGVTLAADALAMLRYPHLWMGSAVGYRLAALLIGMAVFTGVVGLRIRGAEAGYRHPNSATRIRAGIVSIFAAFLLVLYPEHFRRGLIGALSTAFVGTVILFAPVWACTMALIPYASADPEQQLNTSDEFLQKKYHWLIVILVGVLVGLFFVAGEASEGSGIPRARLALVISAYIGLETAGLMVGYGFLGKSLGLFRRRSRQ
jgi:Ca2+/Na+ antiporter